MFVCQFPDFNKKSLGTGEMIELNMYIWITFSCPAGWNTWCEC